MEVKETEAVLAEAEPEMEVANEQPRKLPLWAILLAVVSFIVFNAFFLVYAMQMGSTNPG